MEKQRERVREREKRGGTRKAVSTRNVGGWPTAKAGSIRDDRPLKIAAIQRQRERDREGGRQNMTFALSYLKNTVPKVI